MVVCPRREILVCKKCIFPALIGVHRATCPDGEVTPMHDHVGREPVNVRGIPCGGVGWVHGHVGGGCLIGR